MNETMTTIMNRKSVRAYTDREISPECREQILRAAAAAPTAGNQQLYTILDIISQELKEKLADTCDHQPFIARGKMVLVFCADFQKWYQAFALAGCCPRKPGPGDIFLAVEDAAIAAQNAVTAAESLGIGSCYIGDIMEHYEVHRELFHLPDYVFPALMLVFGYPTQQQKDRPQTSRFPQKMIVMENGYHDLTEEELQEYYPDDKAQAFYKRKYVSDFAWEMDRSALEILKNWEGK